MGTTLETTRFVGKDFTDQDVNIEHIAVGFGARTEEIKDPGNFGEALNQALAHADPGFLIITREP
jgi:benzoylformate decarboxylase